MQMMKKTILRLLSIPANTWVFRAFLRICVSALNVMSNSGNVLVLTATGQVTKYGLVFYVSLVALLMSIVESGVMTSLFAYIGNEFHLNEEGLFIHLVRTYPL